MPITDLTNTTWIINETPSINPPRMYLQHINYISNNVEFTQMYIGYIPELDYENDIWYTGFSSVQAYSSPNWSNQSYRTITITGGTDVTNTNFINWLEANATQQTSSFSNSIYIGDSNIAGAYIGESDVSAMYIGDEKIYEKPAPAPSGYEVTITASGSWNNQSDGTIKIYDGQDNTGTLLLDQTPANKSAYPVTLTFTSGYFHIVATCSGFLAGFSVTSSDFTIEDMSGFRAKAVIDKNGTINIKADDFAD